MLPPGMPFPPPPGTMPPFGAPPFIPPGIPPPGFAAPPPGVLPPPNFVPASRQPAPPSIPTPQKENQSPTPTRPVRQPTLTLPNPALAQANPEFKKPTDLKVKDPNFSPVRFFFDVIQSTMLIVCRRRNTVLFIPSISGQVQMTNLQAIPMAKIHEGRSEHERRISWSSFFTTFVVVGLCIDIPVLNDV